MSFCLAIVATVCLHQAKAIEFQQTRSGSTAIVQFADGRANITIESDTIPRLDKSRMAKECLGEVCFAYFKNCTQQKGFYACSYAATEVTSSRSVVFGVVAPSAEKLDKLEQSMGIVGNSVGHEAELPLSRMERSSAFDNPPFCGDPDSRC